MACFSQSMLPILLILPIFYFLLIRPQQKQEKQRRAMLSSMKKGDQVVTNGGIHGELLEVTDRTVTVKFGTEPGQRMKVDRAAIARILSGDDDAMANPPKG